MIHILDQSLINKIAAGEVIERPASVVKELIENALDAGATTIRIDSERGGKQLIRVTDNGVGMSRDELPLAIHPHATSKIKTIDDLFSITTCGFRGEALASIAAVSEVTIVSKQESAHEGYQLTAHVNAPYEGDTKPVAALPGTCVTCTHVFAALPARQKFLKTDAVEFAHIAETVTTRALIHPSVSFFLSHNGKHIKHFPAQERWEDRIKDVAGALLMSTLIPFSYAAGDFKVSGYVSKPGKGEEKPLYQYVFINKRAVKDFLILKAVKSGFENLIMQREQPNCFLDVTIDTRKVDVNVHPRKLEVRHENPGAMFAFMQTAVRRELRAVPFSPKASVLDEPLIQPVFPARHYQTNGGNFSYGQSAHKKKPHSPNSLLPLHEQSPSLPRGELFPDIPAQSAGRTWRVLGQLHASYIIIENEAGLLLIDQHAAAERITFERLMKEIHDGNATQKQELIIPATLELTLQEYEIYHEARETIAQLGFETEPFGPHTINITTVPAHLKIHNPSALFKDILHDLKENERTATTEPLLHKMLMVVACRSSVKFGDTLTREEQEALITTLEKTQNNNTCIHGRPVSYRLTLADLARIFKRGGG